MTFTSNSQKMVPYQNHLCQSQQKLLPSRGQLMRSKTGRGTACSDHLQDDDFQVFFLRATGHVSADKMLWAQSARGLLWVYMGFCG